MISLPQQLPLIQVGPGQIAACDPEWLQNTLRGSARSANVPDFFADDIVRGVVYFLRNSYRGTVIAIETLFDKIRSSLNDVGLREMSEMLATTPPPISISLTDIARCAGSGYELRFYQILAERFRVAAERDVEHVYCYGLRKSVKHLTGAKNWSPRCESVSLEIQGFLNAQHDRIKAAKPDSKLAMAII